MPSLQTAWTLEMGLSIDQAAAILSNGDTIAVFHMPPARSSMETVPFKLPRTNLSAAGLVQPNHSSVKAQSATLQYDGAAYLQVRINRRLCMCLLDSGADVSLLPARQYINTPT